MADRKKYAPLTRVQKSLAEGSTAILEGGVVMEDVVRLSKTGRYWIGNVANGDIRGREEGQAAEFNSDEVLEVIGL